jgi:threonine synthase
MHDALSFDVPFVEIKPGIFALELFHGPTLAFKDIGAQCMGRILPMCIDPGQGIVDVIVATSGDTGSAIAHGFYGLPGVRIIILYPRDQVTRLQELQMATLGVNTHAVAVHGSFDDCQDLVKQAFRDQRINRDHRLVSGNSINIARWLPQMVYYVRAIQALPYPDIAVPSGNLGNLTAGLLAKTAGVPVGHLMAACNANMVLPHFLETGNFVPRPSVPTVANAMDVGHPSNFERLEALSGGHAHLVRSGLTARSFADRDILQTIRKCYDETGYILDPHGATAYRMLMETTGRGVFLATAHPAKFIDIYDESGIPVALPEALLALEHRDFTRRGMDAGIDALRSFMSALN